MCKAILIRNFNKRNESFNMLPGAKIRRNFLFVFESLTHTTRAFKVVELNVSRMGM